MLETVSSYLYNGEEVFHSSWPKIQTRAQPVSQRGIFQDYFLLNRGEHLELFQAVAELRPPVLTQLKIIIVSQGSQVGLYLQT